MSGYDEAFGKTDTPDPAVVETPAAVESVSDPAPVAEVAPATSEPAAAPAAPVTQPQATPERQEHTAPIAVVLDERDRRKAAEQRAIAAEHRLAEIDRRQREAMAKAPNILDDPEGYHAWVAQRFDELNRGFESKLTQTVSKEREQISRSFMQRHLGKEKFAELDQFIQQAPDQAHAIALKQADPYGWFHEQHERAQEERRKQEVLSKLGGKDLDAFLEEQKQKWLAENQPQAAPAQPAAPVQSDRPRNPDGTFASPSQTQRHQPPSLSVVNGAPAPRGGEVRSGYDAAFNRG